MARTMPEFPVNFDLGAFLSRESHDLKTPFNHIIGFSRIVLKGQDGPLTDFQREDIGLGFDYLLHGAIGHAPDADCVIA